MDKQSFWFVYLTTMMSYLFKFYIYKLLCYLFKVSEDYTNYNDDESDLIINNTNTINNTNDIIINNNITINNTIINETIN